MLPINFPESNFIYTKPADMTDDECMSLPVWRGPTKVDEGQETFPTIISCWKLSKEDLEEVQRTGVVYLSVYGTGMPPVSIFTENPFVSLEELK